MKINISKIIAPHFWNTFNSKKPHQIDVGGRGSTKSSKNTIKVGYHCLTEEKCSAIIIRKYQNTLRNSVYSEMKRALSRLGLIESVDYTSSVSPMKIRLYNGNNIYFAGLDNYEKLKGFIDESRPIKIVLFSEVTEFTDEDEIQQVTATFSRGNDDWFINLYEYNPPKNKYEWINEWCERMSKRPDVVVTHSDYRTVPPEWLGKRFIEEAEQLKIYDEKRYRHIYLGEVVGLDGLIFNYDLINIVDTKHIEENRLKCIYIDLALDVGYSTSATTCLAIGYMTDGNWYLLDTYYYSPVEQEVKKAPSDFADEIMKFRINVAKKYGATIDNETIDSAETALVNEMYKKYGVALHKVDKGTNKEAQIDHAQDFLAKRKFCVLNNNNNKIFLKEMKEYKWQKDSIEKGKAVPDKTEREMKGEDDYFNTNSESQVYSYCDHTCDAFIYWVLDNKEKLGIEF